MKRIGCLYRVSTKKQTYNNDIPVQKNACRNFIKTKKDWKLEKEYIELGVSGYKLSESKRDVLQDIKKDVLKKEIDILLVFMFDRIGRREEETPFVVEWLINEGIEVWSVKEGQRKIENRADKLINYLTYWQAGGESEKTSIRVREAQIQMAENGILTYGGKRNAPYGYTFIKSGTYTKKGVERQKLIINNDEAEIVKEIFTLYIKRGYGIGRIAKYLNDKKIKPRRSTLWSVTTLSKMIDNPLYMGYPAYRKKTTVNAEIAKQQPYDSWILPKNQIEDLAIIEENIWYEAKNIRDSRKSNIIENEKSNIRPIQTKSQLLFIGLIKCGECGYAFMTGNSKKKNKNGEIIQHLYYRCSSTRHTNTCALQKKNIKKDLIENILLKCVYNFLDSLCKIDLTKAIKKGILNNCSSEEKELNDFDKKLNEVDANIEVLKKEVVKALMGESSFSADLLNELINEKENEKLQLLKSKNQLESKLNQKKLKDEELALIKDKIPIWRKEFEKADLDIKKMLLSEIIKEIRIFNDRFEIDFRLELNDYIKEKIVNNDNNEFGFGEAKLVENTISVKLDK